MGKKDSVFLFPGISSVQSVQDDLRNPEDFSRMNATDKLRELSQEEQKWLSRMMDGVRKMSQDESYRKKISENLS